MAIPEEIRDKLDSDPSWAVQHEDIVRVMDENMENKPWSRYMIQQHLGSDPAKKTVHDRLDELVELGVLRKYEYSNFSLYDLAYAPMVTDGGRLRDVDWVDLVTFRDQNAIYDLVTAAIMMSIVFFGFGIITQSVTLPLEVTSPENPYIETAIILYLFAFVLLFITTFSESVKQRFSTADP